jgi:hypothetical protein
MGGFLNAFNIIVRIIVKYFTTPTLVDIFNNIYKFRYVNKEDNPHSKISFDKSGIFKTGNGDFKKESHMSNLKEEVEGTAHVINSKLANNYVQFSRSDSVSKYLYDACRNKSQMKYQLNLGPYEKICRGCVTSHESNKKIELMRKIELKMTKVLSVENFFKITRLTKILKTINFETYHNNLLKVCQVPKFENPQKSLDPYYSF